VRKERKYKFVDRLASSFIPLIPVDSRMWCVNWLDSFRIARLSCDGDLYKQGEKACIFGQQVRFLLQYHILLNELA
jgi:hypothetical protein